MSFGWSAGDIAQAAKFMYNLIRALDAVDGAASNYREAVSFLRDLKRTLEPLQSFTAWQAYPTYGREIEEQVRHIKGPIEAFLATAVKYETSLGPRANNGHRRHVFQKLQWHFVVSKKVLGLKNTIESHIRIIDALLQRLTMDIVWTTQQQLPESLRTSFEQVLRPDILHILRDNLVPLSSMLKRNQFVQASNHDVLVGMLGAYYGALRSEMVELRQQISSFKQTQLPANFKSQCCPPISSFTHIKQQTPLNKQPTWIARNSCQEYVLHTKEEIRQFLRELYYLVFLYLAQFIKSLMILLSQLLQPSRALMPILLAKHNITFLDAIGRPARVLPYEYFQSFEIFSAFVREEFKTLPGSEAVRGGGYIMKRTSDDMILEESIWSDFVRPGSIISMSILLPHRVKVYEIAGKPYQHCPIASCPGMWPYTRFIPGPLTCPTCKKQILMSTEITWRDRGDSASFSSPQDRGKISRKAIKFRKQDIVIFQRVAQELVLGPIWRKAYQSSLCHRVPSKWRQHDGNTWHPYPPLVPRPG